MDDHLSISPLVDWAECLANGFLPPLSSANCWAELIFAK